MKYFSRSSQGRMLFGVCSGLGKYFNIDPVFVRVAFVILFVCYGAGLLLYLLLTILAPIDSNNG